MIETSLIMCLRSTRSTGVSEKYVLWCDPTAILVIMSPSIYFPNPTGSDTSLLASSVVLTVFWIATVWYLHILCQKYPEPRTQLAVSLLHSEVIKVRSNDILLMPKCLKELPLVSLHRNYLHLPQSDAS